jgi:hypothetical protein
MGPEWPQGERRDKMATRKTNPATGDVANAEAAKDAAVLEGVTAETGSVPARRARKAPATGKAPATPKATTANAKGSGRAPAKANGSGDKAPGYRRYATAEVPTAMVGFSKWISREFADLFPDGVDPRLVTIASKGYRYFQASDLNK